MPFLDPDERPNDERNLKIEIAVLLALSLVPLIAGPKSAWSVLTALL